MSALLELENVHAAYGLSRVLFGISLEVNQGECVCLLGRNGVGKTTTMRTVMGLTPPSTGHVRFKSNEITGWAPYRVARAGIGFGPEDRRVFSELSVWENLDVARRAARRPGHWTIESVIELFPVLGGVSPMTVRMVVVLPTPFRPSRQTHSPWLTASEMPNSTRLSP